MAAVFRKSCIRNVYWIFHLLILQSLPATLHALGTLLARLGNQCDLSSSPQDSLFFTALAAPLPIDAPLPALLLTLPRTSRQLYVLFARLVDGSKHLCFGELESGTVVDEMQVFFSSAIEKRPVPALVQVPGISFTAISINLHPTHPSRLRFFGIFSSVTFSPTSHD